MNVAQILAIRRDDRFSPNAVENDLLILQASCREIRGMLGLDGDIRIVDEEDYAHSPQSADCCISMGRADETLACLTAKVSEGCVVVNAPHAVSRCRRSFLHRLMVENHIPVPEEEGAHGYWLKRGDVAAQSAEDVVFCPTPESLCEAKDRFKARGISDMLVSAHVPGDLVKFYGVGTRFFKYFYPTDDGVSKFGDEIRNGMAHHYHFDCEALRAEVFRLAEIIGTDVYGGDAIVGEDGQYFIIDFNDWPSFSRCREEAARAIAAQVVSKLR